MDLKPLALKPISSAVFFGFPCLWGSVVLSDRSPFKLWESKVVYCVKEFRTYGKGKWRRERESPLWRLLEADCCASFLCLHFFLWFYPVSLSLGALLCLCIFVFVSLPSSSISVSVSVCLSLSLSHTQTQIDKCTHFSQEKRICSHKGKYDNF